MASGVWVMGTRLAMLERPAVRRVTRAIAMVGVALMLATGLAAVQHPDRAEAATASSFQAGYIISDAQFYNSRAMSEAQIQSFLNSKNSGLRNYRDSVASRDRVVSDSTGNLRCGAFSGGSNLLASTIIYRAQVACGISAKVILVTLQKEQGLINKSSPSTAALDRAMGYACPDTAPCAEYALGFGNQVYMGVLQLNTYKAARFGMQPGTNWIQWHPNSACGGSSVNVRNYATAALYNYTPYRPNEAALNSYPGTGNSCSSYGNRNFWFQYNAWFGSPTAVDGAFAINEAYELAGGASGVLGAQLAELDCPAGSTKCWQEYEHGYVGWTNSTGAYVSSGVIGELYRDLGGPSGSLGYPLMNLQTVAANGGGVVQAFQHGLVNAGPEGPFVVNGAIRTKHGQLGGVGGPIGWPVSAERCGLPAGGCSQEFQNGFVSVSESGASYSVTAPPILSLYKSLGGPAGPLGLPLMSTQTVSANGGGVVQAFQNGLVNAGPEGAFLMNGAVRSAHGKLGGVGGPVGWPVAAEVCGLPDGGCSQEFQEGVIFTSRSNGGHVISSPAVMDLYESLGGPAGSLGYPIMSSQAVLANGGGFAQAFQNALVNAGPEGAFVMKGAIRTKHGKLGGVGGPMGWPIAAEVCGLPDGGCSQAFQNGTIHSLTDQVAWDVAGLVAEKHAALGGNGGELGTKVGDLVCSSNDTSCWQEFEHGFITWTKQAGLYVSSGVIGELYRALGGPSGSLGYPLMNLQTVSANGGGVVQAFQNGLVNAGPEGAFLMNGAVRSAHGKLGGVGGPVGWPVAAEVCGLPDGGCSQEFQEGVIFTSRSNGGHVISSPAVMDLYESLGGPAGSLGYPIMSSQAVLANGGGFAQAFQNALVNAGPEGAFVMKGAIRTKHGKLGGVGGPMGWPIAAEVCGLPDGGCSQAFQNGTIHSLP